MSEQAIIRITKEIGDIQRGADLSLAVHCNDEDVRSLRAIIMGPPDTPYEYGFFEFTMNFSREYPRKAPNVQSITTNSGRTRFNPNIYSNGKVCLSILGTWRGESSEQWSPAQGMESILLSIQSLMSPNPYENEPGFENAGRLEDKINQIAYVKKICHETLRLTVIQRLEQYLGIESATGTRIADLEVLKRPEFLRLHPFLELVKQRFRWYYESYEQSIMKGMVETQSNEPFLQMPFENGGNIMTGCFNYSSLLKRIQTIRRVMEEDMNRAIQQGLYLAMNENGVAHSLHSKFRQICTIMKASDTPHELGLDNNNPFAWILTYFAPPMGCLSGGVLRIRLNFTRYFPLEQPIVRLETPVFHLRVAKDGTLVYFPTVQRREDIKHHIEMIIESLDDENPSYDPRACVNAEAFKLFWGKPDERKTYSRRCRRSVEDAMDQMAE